MSRKQFYWYWFGATGFAILCGEVITGLISGNPMFFLNAWPISIYYFILCFIFALLAKRLSLRQMLIIFFDYGVLVELYLFHNIASWARIDSIIFFGLLYVFLFGLPLKFVKSRKNS